MTLPAQHYRVYVNYVQPSFEEMQLYFSHVCDLWDGVEWTLHESLTGTVMEPCELIIYLHRISDKMTSDQVIAWAEANGYRVATHLEALAYVRADVEEGRRPNWWCALGAFRWYDPEPLPENRFVAVFSDAVAWAVGLEVTWPSGASFFLVRVAPFETSIAE